MTGEFCSKLRGELCIQRSESDNRRTGPANNVQGEGGRWHPKQGATREGEEKMQPNAQRLKKSSSCGSTKKGVTHDVKHKPDIPGKLFVPALVILDEYNNGCGER